MSCKRATTFCAHVHNHEDGYDIVVMERTGKAMGELSYYDIFPNECQISRISTEEQFRRLGLANRILDNLEKIAENNGLTTIRLAVDETESWLVDWYKRRGYKYYTKFDDTNYIGMERVIKK